MASAESAAAHVVRLEAGPRFASHRERVRSFSRIQSAADALSTPVIDADVCWIEGRSLATAADWAAVRLPRDLPRIDGPFVAAWREDDGTLVLARDPIGERSLFYALIPGGAVFASTLPALLARGAIRPRLHHPSVAAYLTYAYVPGRETLLEGVYKVLPGETVRIRAGAVERRPFWSLPPEPEHDEDEPTLRERLRAALERAVARRLSPGPIAAFLSGGLDSSLVVALARRGHEGPLITYSICFGPEYPNELAWSSLVAAHCRTDHHIVEVTPGAVSAHLDETMALLGDPIGDPLTVPNALLFREASRSSGVVLNGEGGDPCFGGPKNLPMILSELFGTDDARLERARSYLRAHLKCYDDLEALLTPTVREALAEAPLEAALEPHLDDPRWPRFLTRLMALNVVFKGAHHILPKVDALSAPFGVVPRAPLFDREVVEVAFAIPPQLKLRGSVEKYLLKQSVAELLPTAILDRPKSGMLVPVEAWFRGPLLAFARERLLESLPGYDVVRRDWTERLLNGRLAGPRPRRGAKIWLLLALESWLRAFVPRG